VTAPLVGFDSTVNRAAPYQEDDSSSGERSKGPSKGDDHLGREFLGH
jgi:hypothetical protein